MGWWDAWNKAKETTKGWGEFLWNSTSAAKAVKGTANFTYNTVVALFSLVSVIPKVAYSAVFHSRTRGIATNLLRIGIEDLLPLVLVTHTNELIQKHGRDYLEDEPDEAWLSVDTAVQAGLLLLNTATWVYSVRKKTQMTVRAAVLAITSQKSSETEVGVGQEVSHPRWGQGKILKIESSGEETRLQIEFTTPEPGTKSLLLAREELTESRTGNPLTSVKGNPFKKLCEEERCSQLRFLKGSFRDSIAYWATEAAIYFVEYVPLVGRIIAAMLTVPHRGRYVMTLVLPDLCSRHQEQYLTEYSEHALAHGIAHTAMAAASTHFIEAYTGIPKALYKTAMEQLLLIVQTQIASHMRLPPPVKTSVRNIPDPVACYQSFIGFSIDTLILGLKKQIPRLLKERQVSIIPWEDIPAYMKKIWFNPAAEAVKPLLIPRMLQSRKAFINDPVIPWVTLRSKTIDAIENIEAIRGMLIVKFASRAPGPTSKALWLIFGTPKSVIKLLLKLMGNKQFMEQLGDLRRSLGGMHSGVKPPVPVDKKALALLQASITETESSSLNLLPHSPTLFKPKTDGVIKRRLIPAHTQQTGLPDSGASSEPNRLSIKPRTQISTGLFPQIDSGTAKLNHSSIKPRPTNSIAPANVFL